MYYLGVDVGSVSTDVVLIDKSSRVVSEYYLKTKGRPIEAVLNGIRILKEKFYTKQIDAVGTTGSGRNIAGFLLGADIIKNEITAHAMAALNCDNEVKTIIEIGGQDSKIIILKDGIVTDFAMNSVCAAGTGSFLDRQAERLEIPIEKFGEYAIRAKNTVRIAGRCAVFAESDMIHKQQLGYSEESIIKGLCQALVRNYLSNVGKGKEIKEKIFFQGGVAANVGMKAAFEEALGCSVEVPDHFNMMGAIGAALLSKEFMEKSGTKSRFKGFDIADMDYKSRNFECTGCSNRCEVAELSTDSKAAIGFFGDRCGRWSRKSVV